MGAGGWVWRPCVGLNPNGLPANSTTWVFPSYHPSWFPGRAPSDRPATNIQPATHLPRDISLVLATVAWLMEGSGCLRLGLSLPIREFIPEIHGAGVRINCLHITKCLVQWGLWFLRKTLCYEANSVIQHNRIWTSGTCPRKGPAHYPGGSVSIREWFMCRKEAAFLGGPV